MHQSYITMLLPNCKWLQLNVYKSFDENVAFNLVWVTFAKHYGAEVFYGSTEPFKTMHLSFIFKDLLCF